MVLAHPSTFHFETWFVHVVWFGDVLPWLKLRGTCVAGDACVGRHEE